MYDTYGGVGGWLVFGGTSASAPLIAGVYALAGNAGAVSYGSFPYAHTASLFDVTSGSNGQLQASARYLCTAGSRLRRPDGPRHAERRRRVLTPRTGSQPSGRDPRASRRGPGRAGSLRLRHDDRA